MSMNRAYMAGVNSPMDEDEEKTNSGLLTED